MCRFSLIVAVATLPAFVSPLRAQIPLPSNWDSYYAGASGYSYVDVSSYASDYDSDSDSNEIYEVGYAVGYAANIVLHPSASHTLGNGDAQTYGGAMIVTGAEWQNYPTRAAAEITQYSESYETGAPVYMYTTVSAQAFGHFVIGENGSYPDEGHDTGSAVLNAYFSFVSEPAADAENVELDVDMQVTIGSSHIEVYTLDSSGDNWVAVGSLSQIGDDPVAVSDTFLTYQYVNYTGHEATEIGASIFVESVLIATTSCSPSGTVGTHSYGVGEYQVLVP